MYPGMEATEYLSVVGTSKFMDFVESIQSEGVELERKPMGAVRLPKLRLLLRLIKKTLKRYGKIGY